MGFQPKSKGKLVSEINVTPLVDVMLVLLIIFMISAPMLYSGIKLQLPKTAKVNNVNLSDDQVVVSISETAEFFIGKEKILKDELLQEIKISLQKTKQTTVYVRAHYTLKYGLVAQFISSLKLGGISEISLVTQNENDEGEQ